MRYFTKGHWAAVGMILSSLAVEVATLPEWGDAAAPAFAAKIGLALGATITAINSEKTNTVRVDPPKP